MWLLDNFLWKRSHTPLMPWSNWWSPPHGKERRVTGVAHRYISLSFPSNQASWALELINKNLPTRRGHTSTDLCPDRCCRSHGWKVEATFQQDRTLLTFEKSLASTGYLLRISWPRMGWTWSWWPSGLNGFRQASDISHAIYLFIPTYSHVRKST